MDNNKNQPPPVSDEMDQYRLYEKTYYENANWSTNMQMEMLMEIPSKINII